MGGDGVLPVRKLPGDYFPLLAAEGGARSAPGEGFFRARPRSGVLLQRLFVLLLLLLPAYRAATAQSSADSFPRIGLVTMAPGDVYWSRFGHNAVLVSESDGRETLYNYGFFDFEEPGFLVRFLRGEMMYYLAALPLQQDLANYRSEGRGVTLQWLMIAPQRARELADFLAWNARPENARYRYDYFTDNCATRVRDALDRALGGALRRALQSRSRGLTYRSESLRLGAGELWLYLGMHAGLGPYADQPLSRWDEAFVPMRLAEALREVEIDGHPLVQEEIVLLPHRLAPEPASPPRWRWIFLAAGMAIAATLFFTLRSPAPRLRQLGGGTALLIWLASSLGGLLLLMLWLFTDHVAAWRNQNLLLFNPLTLVLLPAAFAWLRGRAPGRLMARLGLLIAVMALVALAIKTFPTRPQDNGDWIALWLPVHLALAWLLRCQRASILEPGAGSGDDDLAVR